MAEQEERPSQSHDEGARPIIFKKIVRKHGGGHHGGSWKVAYADFVTAMMAFFLLMWLLTMTDEKKKFAIENYFQHFSLFQASGLAVQNTSAIGDQNRTIAFVSEAKTNPAYRGEKQKVLLEKMVDEALSDLKDNILIEIIEGDIRITIHDTGGKSIYESGSTEPNENGRRILAVIGRQLKLFENTVTVEGHTDAIPYAGKDMTNWELSTMRAVNARKLLEGGGVPRDRFEKVMGLAAQDLLMKDEPNDPRNRRITLQLRSPFAKVPKTQYAVEGVGDEGNREPAPVESGGGGVAPNP